jgi:polyhydroxyalkanoate synthesis regulator phasin
MVKKLKQISEKKAASASGLMDSALAGAVKDSAQQIWLAGMGAFSKAQEEGGKVTSRMTDMAGGVQAKAGQHWDKLETIFEERTARALNKLGVPSAKDVAALMQRIDALSAEVAKLSRRAAPAKAAAKAAAKAPATKPVVRRAARKTA